MQSTTVSGETGKLETGKDFQERTVRQNSSCTGEPRNLAGNLKKKKMLSGWPCPDNLGRDVYKVKFESRKRGILKTELKGGGSWIIEK